MLCWGHATLRPVAFHCRYQYLELAYYIINGRCQDPDNPGDNGFILNLYTYPSINDFLKQSPKVITNDTPELFAKEYVFGARVSMQHGYTKEDRAFLYTDKQVRTQNYSNSPIHSSRPQTTAHELVFAMQGRTIEMIYMQYFHELYARLHQRLVAADNFKPTDVFINFGVWFVLPEPRDTTCGEIEDPESKCPYMPALCDYFKEDHDYNVYWMASSPSRDTDEATELNYNIGPGHNLNPSTKCDMSNIGVNNRSAMIEMLVPEDKDRYKLFWDRHHFKTPDPYHAMNWDLIKQVKKMVGSGAKDNR